MRTLYENEIFTGLASNGESVPQDEEWSVKHTCKYSGKVERKDMRKKLLKSVSRIPSWRSNNLVQQELHIGTGTGSKSKRRTRDWLNTDSPIILLCDLVHIKMKLWHHIDQPIIGNYMEKKPTYAEPNAFNLPDKETLNPDVLMCFDIGLQRVTRYMQYYYMYTPFEFDRSEKEIPITKILASSIDRKHELKKAIDKDKSFIKDDASINKDEVGEKLQWVADKLNVDIEMDEPDLIYVVPIHKLNKEDRIKKLMQLRRIYFKSFSPASSSMEDAAGKVFEDRYPSVQSNDVSGEVILSKKIYCLSKNVLNSDRYKSQLHSS